MTERLWAPWRLEYVQTGADAGGCVLCDAVAGDDPAGLIVHRGEHAYVLMNLYPYSNGHVMVAPYRHLAEPGDLDAAERAEIWSLFDQAVRALTAAMSPQGFNAGINLGRVAGAGRRGPHPPARGAALERRHELHAGAGRRQGHARARHPHRREAARGLAVGLTAQSAVRANSRWSRQAPAMKR